MQAGIILKKNKERPIRQRHHWIYSGAVQSLPSPEAGNIVPVYSAQKELLGLAAISRGHSIIAHMLSFGSMSLEDSLRDQVRKAFLLRKNWFDPVLTNSYRLINAEGDGIPGLIVDSYDGILVMQISHPGIESIRELIVSILVEEVCPKGIYEKSTSFLRKKEGLTEVRSHRWGVEAQTCLIRENGLIYRIDLEKGQKTGWFFDQREMRKLVFELSNQRRVLNVFAYTGGFSISALAGGAQQVDSVEISAKCEALIRENISLNQLSLEKHRFFGQDAFNFLKNEPLDYDLIILDPPAFVKKREDIAEAFRAYKELNRLTISKMKPGSVLMTCSCSYHVDEPLFQNIIFRAAHEANRQVRFIGKHRQALDHPVSVFHPESVYLKSFVLYLD